MILLDHLGGLLVDLVPHHVNLPATLLVHHLHLALLYLQETVAALSLL